MNEALVLNKRTNRFVKVGTPRYLRLLREGAVDPPPPPPKPEASAEPPATREPTATATATAAAKPQPQPPPNLRANVIEQATDIVRENKEQFLDLSQRETDKLLRRMLYEKLCVAKKKKKKKKVKFKSRKVDSSSSSSSED